jgi:nucleoside-diphosphate-sugar epimerase
MTMLEYLESENVTCGKIMRHEASGDARETRVWTYRNDLGEEFLAGSKSECRRVALKDLRLCRVDLVVEYTAVGGIHRFDYSDTFQEQNINDLADRLKRARGREAWFEKLHKAARKENMELKAKLMTISRFAGGSDD